MSTMSNEGIPSDLIIDPPEITMKAAGDKFALQIIKKSQKEKSSSNEMYRIDPVYSIIEPNQGASLEIQRMIVVPKVDKLVVEYMYCAEKPPNAEQHFKANAKKGSINVKLTTN